MKDLLSLLKVAFYFPFCWVFGGIIAIVILHFAGLSDVPIAAGYFAVAIGGTVWFWWDSRVKK